MRTHILCVAVIVAGAEQAQSALITDPSQLIRPTIAIDFEGAVTNGQLVTPLSNPVTFGDATFRSLTGQLSIFDISLSGSWPINLAPISGKTLFPGGEPDSAISIEFNAPVSEVLIGWGDPDFLGNRLQAFDIAGNLLEEAMPQLDPPSQTSASWIGFSRASADIAKIIVLPDQSMPSGDDYLIDNIYYSVAPVPEPASLAIWGGICLIGLAVRSRRRDKRAI